MKIINALTLIFLLSSCASVDKYINSGNYDEALKLGVSKFKKTKKSKFLQGIESAFESAQTQDLDQIEYLKKENAANSSVKILSLYNKIEKRQNLLKTIVNLKDKEGYSPQLRFVEELDSKKAFYSNRASDYYYENAQNNLKLARNGNKEAAKTAFKNLEDFQKLNGSDNANISTLKKEAKDLGTTFILIQPIIGSEVSLSSEMTNLFLDFGTKDINTEWTSAHFSPDRNQKYDIEARLVLLDFNISPEKENTREYEDKKEIEEDTGRKDREGKKVYQKKEVKAKVIEVYQFKEAQVWGIVSLYDLKKNKELSKQDVKTAYKFENYASTYVGDVRALSDVTKKRIGNKPVKFPSNNQILGDAIVKLKEDMVSKMKNSYIKY